MLLTADEHCIGRFVDDTRFQIESTAISANHCKIYRRRLNADELEYSVFLKDTSTNGTYLNWERLRKNTGEAKLRHGDIVSLSAPPQHEFAFAFVYREVLASTLSIDAAVAKRKAEELVSDNKRLKGIGIGIGAPEGPISLDDFRSLQRSNTELRKQLEYQVRTIDSLHKENRACLQRHDNEMKEVKESVTKSYLDQLNGLHDTLEVKQRELESVNRISAEQKHAVEDLNRRLNASIQSCMEANAIMESQKASIAELKAQLFEERDQRREEREKAATDLKAAVQRAQSEAQEEFKRLSDSSLRQERELQEVINKLQESEKESCLLVDTLRFKLEDARQKLVISDNKVRQLETEVCEEQLASANGRKRVEELEHEMRRLRKYLEIEKSAREEAWAKVSALELEINATMRDLDFERQRLKGARERIMLRETQLRAFYSTTEEISVLFAKQQQQLKAMQKTLEDEENYENTSVDIDLNVLNGVINGTVDRENEATAFCSKITAKTGPAASAQGSDRIQVENSSDEASSTEKHDCDFRSQEECQNTQEAEFTSANHGVKAGFGSDIDGVGTAPVLEGDAVGTERVLETESPGIDGEPNIDLNKCSPLAGDTMQLDDEAHVQETDEQTLGQGAMHHSPLNNPDANLRSMEDTEPGGTIRTDDLLASEVAGSWACSTAPSVHGEDESPRSRNNDEGTAAQRDSNLQVAESQSSPSSEVIAKRRNRPQSRVNDEEGAAALLGIDVPVAESQVNPSAESVSRRRNQERQALSEMIGIVAPDLKEQFGGAVNDDSDRWREKRGSTSDSDTESHSKDDEDNGDDVKVGSMSDAETEGCDHDQADDDHKLNDAMDEDDEATQEDSLG